MGRSGRNPGRRTHPDGTDRDRLAQLYAEQLADIRAAEARAAELFPDMAVVASDEELATLFRAAAAESEVQLARLGRLIAGAAEDAGPAVAMDGYLSEAAAILGGELEASRGDADTTLLRSARRSLRYQIAGYESACATARRLGEFRALDALLQSLDEELATDSAMSRIVSRRSRMLRAI